MDNLIQRRNIFTVLKPLQVVDLRLILQHPGKWTDLATILKERITAESGILRMQIQDDVKFSNVPVYKKDLTGNFLKEFATSFFHFDSLHSYQDLMFVTFIEV